MNHYKKQEGRCQAIINRKLFINKIKVEKEGNFHGKQAKNLIFVKKFLLPFCFAESARRLLSVFGIRFDGIGKHGIARAGVAQIVGDR